MGAALLLLGCGASGPDLAALEREPVLTPPVDAVELGRAGVASGRGLLGPDTAAVLEVAFAVEVDEETAARRWVEAYGDRYGLRLPDAGALGQVLGGSADVGVSLQTGSRVQPVVGGPDDFRAPPAGTTVVMVVVSARLDR